MKLSNHTITLLTRINLLCIEISQTTEHDAHYHYSGHVNSLRVSVDIGGYKYAEHSNYHLEMVEVRDLDADLFEQCIAELEGYLV